MELSDQPMESPDRSGGYPQGRFILLLVLLAAMLVALAAAQFEGMRAVEPSGVSESVLQGDVQAKLAYYYAHSFTMLKPQAGQSAALAVLQYERSIREEPSPEVYRRLIVLSHEFRAEDTAHYIKEFGRLKANRSESEMWGGIYLARKLDRSQAVVYQQRIRRLHLGWYEPVALSHLLGRAGLTEQAQAQQMRAAKQALQTLVLLALLVVVLIVLGLTGIGLLLWYAGRRRIGAGSKDMPSASDDPILRSRVAGFLLEGFIIYMLAIIGVQVVGGLALAAADVQLGAMAEVIVTVAAYVLSGLLAMFVLAERLRAAGMTWADIGLRSRRPLIDVLWGIGAYAAALPLVLVTTLIAQWVSRYIPAQENPIVPLFIESGSWVAKVALFLLAVVAAPFFEELFFRGVLFSSLRAKWGVAAGVIISAVVFGAVHPLPMGLLPILVLGAVFAVAFNERGSLLPNMVAHACTNAVAFALLFILAG